MGIDVRGARPVLDDAVGVEAAAPTRAVAAGLQHSHTVVQVAAARGLGLDVVAPAVGTCDLGVGFGGRNPMEEERAY